MAKDQVNQTSRRVKKEATVWEKTFSIDSAVKGLIK